MISCCPTIDGPGGAGVSPCEELGAILAISNLMVTNHLFHSIYSYVCVCVCVKYVAPFLISTSFKGPFGVQDREDRIG